MTELKKKFSYYVVLVIVFAAILLCLLFFQKAERERRYLEDTTLQQQHQLKALIYSLNTVADALFTNILNREEVLSIMASASRGSAKEQQHLRETLYDTLLPLYNNLQEQSGASLFNFHLPGSIGFLRFQRPDFFGDKLEGKRHSIDLVNETGKMIKGFEQGPLFYGFRNVYPLYYQEEFIGSVEISFPFLAIRNLATSIFPAIYSFMLRKDIIDQTVLVNAKSMYKPCKVSSHHLKLKEVVARTRVDLPKLGIVSFEVLKKINSQLRERVEQKLLLGLEFSVAVQVPEEDKTLIVTFLPIRDVQGDVVAYFSIYRPDNTLSDSHKRLSRIMLGVFVFAVCFLAGGYVYFRQEKKKDLYEYMAMTDRLTKVANRQHFDLILDQISREAKRRKEIFSLVLLDIDDFKLVNDTYGHDAGDKVLVSLARLLQSNTREQDFVARWGGEEFTIILPETSGEQAFYLCEKIRQLIQALVIRGPALQLKITCSFGVAEYSEELQQGELLKRADNALYRAKRKGKNRVVTWEA
jgi:diguanylate cyclase (GGDEF)-like protein